MKLSRAALRPLLSAHERGALPLVRAAWGVTAREAIHRRSPLTRAEPCHWSERRGVSLRERRTTDARRSRARSLAIGRSGVGCHCKKGETPTLAAHERGALPLVGAAWGVTARKASHRRSPLTRAEPCHWSERRGVSRQERRATMQVMPGYTLAAGKMGRNSSLYNRLP